jgi:pimeloyl-ACP methyl ester carboxylesterase
MSFTEKFVEADGFRIRYMEAGEGPVLVHLHGAGGLRLSPAHDLLAQHNRVVAFEMPGFGTSAENAKSANIAELASTMAQAISALGLTDVNLWGTSFGGRTAVWLAVQHPERLKALILDAPAAIRPEGTRAPSGTPEEMARMLFAHPERVPPLPPVPAAIRDQTQALVRRLSGPGRDPELERRMGDLAVPTLVLFGTLDRVIPPSMGRFYKELIPTCNLVLVYDAGHAIGTDRPEAFADAVGDFIERREAFVISRTETVIHP